MRRSCKVCGVLIETQAETVIGVCVNCVRNSSSPERSGVIAVPSPKYGFTKG